MFKEVLDEVLGVEGDWSNHPSDSGGKTMFGITERLARKYGYVGEMQKIPISFAERIYKEEFWDSLDLDTISKISPTIVRELMDTSVNQGTGRGAEYLQLSLNALNRQQKDFNDIRVDGDVGPATLSALRAFIHKRGSAGELVLLRCLNSLQGAFYINLSQRRQKDEDFVYGWILNRVVI